MKIMPEPELLSIKQASAKLGQNIGEQKVQKLMEAGILELIELNENRTKVTTLVSVMKFIDLMRTKPIDTGWFKSYPMSEQIKKITRKVSA